MTEFHYCLATFKVGKIAAKAEILLWPVTIDANCNDNNYY